MIQLAWTSETLPEIWTKGVVQHYQTGFWSGKSTTDQLFALRHIQTHHLFINFKVAHDTIIRNEVYVSTSYGSNMKIQKEVLDDLCC
jgi:hypothetical protein